MLNFGIIPGSFGLFYTLIEFLVICVHNSNFKYKHMLQCTKASLKITSVSSGKFLGPMSEMGMKFKYLGVMARLELGFLILVNPKHA